MFDRNGNSVGREPEHTAGPHKHSSWPQANIQMVREKLFRVIWPEITTGSNWHRRYQSRSGKE
jgi:hypothetical protein